MAFKSKRLMIRYRRQRNKKGKHSMKFVGGFHESPVKNKENLFSADKSDLTQLAFLSLLHAQKEPKDTRGALLPFEPLAHPPTNLLKNLSFSAPLIP